MTDLLTLHRERFLAYVAGQRPLAGEQVRNIDLKREHTLRVLDNARLIAEGVAAGTPLAAELAETAQLSALYHDTGRFPQLIRYGTFKDAQSENHGRLGVRTLRAENLLDGLPEARRKTVLAAVILHNRRALQPNLPADIGFCARVVRDADKLDILKIMAEHFGPDSDRDRTVLLGLPDEPGRYTPVVLEQVRAKAQANYADMRVVNDFKLLLVSWVYDLNFTASWRLMRDRRLLDLILGFLPDLPEFKALATMLRDDLAAFSS